MRMSALGLLVVCTFGFGQAPTFHKDIEPILQKNCQTWEEMFGGGISVIVPRGTDVAALVKRGGLRGRPVGEGLSIELCKRRSG